MIRIKPALGCLLFYLIVATESTCQVTSEMRPNILLIISDDAGYADFGFQGSNVMKTPNLDKLAKQGIRFGQAYVTAAVCGPSRAGVLTGKYQQRFGYEENNVPGYMSDSCLDDNEMGLPLDQRTLGDYMKDLGYRTAYFGKWHQGNADQFHPQERGFDEFYGFRGGARSYFAFDEGNLNKRNEDWLEEGFKNYQESPKYLTDALADRLIAYLDQDNEEPFFAILSFNAVHTPMEAMVEDMAQFPQLEGERKTLAAMTLSMDRAIGRVLDELDKQNLNKNTVVVFTNDNGGPSDTNSSDNSPLSGTKANHLEGGIRVPFLMRWEGQLASATSFEFPISTLDLLPTFYSAGGGNMTDLADIDGIDLLPYVMNENQERPHQTLYWKKENRGAVRDGDWKFLRFPDRPAELYNLADDVSEVNNLAAEHPEKVRELYKKLFEWEVTLDRPRWQLQRKYEDAAMKRMDSFRKN